MVPSGVLNPQTWPQPLGASANFGFDSIVALGAHFEPHLSKLGINIAGVEAEWTQAMTLLGPDSAALPPKKLPDVFAFWQPIFQQFEKWGGLRSGGVCEVGGFDTPR